jgi:hypothetical protein
MKTLRINLMARSSSTRTVFAIPRSTRRFSTDAAEPPSRLRKVDNFTPIPLVCHPSIYTIPSIGNELNFFTFEKEKDRLFSTMYTTYVPPDEFKFKLPEANKCEIAFIGRSNVGKSSLIDALLGNKKIAKISKEPGCTTAINYFAFVQGVSVNHKPNKQFPIHKNQHAFYLVDMPGYGHANRSRFLVKYWNQALNSYLLVRNQSVLR